MPPSVFIIDTSYLTELYEVPGRHATSFAPRVKARFDEAIAANGRLFVPFPALFEWANHVAHIHDGTERLTHAQKLHKEIHNVMNNVAGGPAWKVWGADKAAVARFEQSLLALIKNYAEQYANLSIGLTDSVMIHAAEELKAKYRTFGFPVHIWTKERRLKSHEPDPEPNPLLE